MKLNKWYVFGIIIASVIIFFLQMQLPQRYDWTATFDSKDRNPFGCYVMDSVFKQMMPKGYRVEDSTLYQLSQTPGARHVLIVANYLPITDRDTAAIRKIAEKGGKIMIAGYVYDSDVDSLLFSFLGASVKGYDGFSLKGLKQQIESEASYMYDTIRWVAPPYSQCDYRVYRMLRHAYVDTCGHHAGWTSLAQSTSKAWDDRLKYEQVTDVVAVKRKFGNGEVILVSMPLLFTNYMVLDKGASGLVFRLMNEMADRPVVRLHSTAERDRSEQLANDEGLFRSLLKSPPLQWALYFTMLVILLFFIFTARRRQRVIPFIEPPKNNTLEFVQLIGTLYFQRKDHAGLVKTKFAYFADVVRRHTGVDVFDVGDSDHTFRILSSRCGQTYEEVAQTIKELRFIYANENNISVNDMKKMIDKMNKIERAIRT